jgi:hypothetical protein
VEWPDDGYLFGAVCPASRVGAGLLLLHVDVQRIHFDTRLIREIEKMAIIF